MRAAKWRTPSKGRPRFVGLDEKVFKAEPVRQFALHKVDAGREQVAPAMAQIVENHSLVSLFGKQARNSATDVPGTAGNQYLHKKDCPFVNSFGTLEVYYNRAWLEGQEASGQAIPGRAARPTDMFCSSLILPVMEHFRHAI